MKDFKKLYLAAEIEARALAMGLWKEYYQKESPNFELGDSVGAIILQIDNMITGILEPDIDIYYESDPDETQPE